MAVMKIQPIGDVPCLRFSVPGGLMAWSEWMTDSLALLSVADENGRLSAGGLISFNSGQAWVEAPLAEAAVRSLAAAGKYLLLPIEFPDQNPWEGCLLKNEVIDTTGYFYEGIKRQTKGDCQGALEAYQKAAAANPSLTRVSNLQGLCLRLLNRPEEAEQAYLREIERMPGLPDPYGNLGILYVKTGRQSLARTMFEKSLERNPLYWNGLLQLSKLVLEMEGPGSRLLSSLNQRLLVAYSGLPQVQEHIMLVVGKKGVSLQEYAAQLPKEGGVLSDSSVLLLLKRVEDLRQNGALLAAVRGYGLLLNRAAPGTPLETYLLHWVAQRLDGIAGALPEFMQESYQAMFQELIARWPSLAKQELKKELPGLVKTSALTPEEFFECVLVEVLKDGQIKPEEIALVFRMKNALRIDETTHQKIFRAVENRMKTNPQVDDGGDFSALSLYRQLFRAVMRDGILEPAEKKLLNIAREALEITPEEAEKAAGEVNP